MVIVSPVRYYTSVKVMSYNEAALGELLGEIVSTFFTFCFYATRNKICVLGLLAHAFAMYFKLHNGLACGTRIYGILRAVTIPEGFRISDTT